MWCSSLRKRPEWAPAVHAFPSITPSIKEGKLGSHDIALPTKQHTGRKATEKRLDHLYHVQGGLDVAVVVLVDPRGQDKNPMEGFMKLQIDLLEKKVEINVVPLLSASDIPNTLAALRPSLPEAQPVAPASLLQHMATRKPLSEHMTNLLSELGRNPAEVAALAETEEGKARIRDLLGKEDGERVLKFLEQELVVFLT